MEVINDTLKLTETIEEDNSITSYQYRNYTPTNQNLNDGSDIIIDVNANNIFLNPSDSYLIIEGQLRKDNANHDAYAADDEVALVNNAMMYLFSQISYSINDKEMERIVCSGQTTSMLGYLKYPDDYNTSSGLMTCWSKDTNITANSLKYAADQQTRDNPNYNQGFATRKSLLMSSNPRGCFQFMIPFSHMFGFAEYTRVIWGMKHTLKLTQNTNNNLAIYRGARS